MIPVIIDTREPDEGNTRNVKGRYLFVDYPDVVSQVKKLAFGDYSLEGYESKVSSDRKTLPDLFTSLINERERFECVVAGLSTFDAGYVIVEASFADICNGAKYRKAGKVISPTPAKINSVKGTITGWMLRYKVPFLFAGDRQSAEWITYDVLRKYWLRKQKELKSVTI